MARDLEFRIWRWALLAALLFASWFVARSARWERAAECEIAESVGYICPIMDRWTGTVRFQLVSTDEIRGQLTRDR